jgi:polyhydroxyalkanoate synthesis regulator phasin
MNELMQCANSGKPWAMARAIMAHQISQGLQSGEIQPAEAKELLEDLIRTDKLDEEADDMALKAMLVTGIYAVIQICG